jgi:hypothetical protein
LFWELTRRGIITTTTSGGYFIMLPFIGHFVFGLLMLLFFLGLLVVHGMNGLIDLSKAISGFFGAL